MAKKHKSHTENIVDKELLADCDLLPGAFHYNDGPVVDLSTLAIGQIVRLKSPLTRGGKVVSDGYITGITGQTYTLSFIGRDGDLKSVVDDVSNIKQIL